MLRGLLAISILAVACAAPPSRDYYGPVGVDFGDTIGSWEFENESESFQVRCQGSYLNTVDGQVVRTVHLQLTATRTHGEPLMLSLEDIVLKLLGTGPTITLPVSAIWDGSEQIVGALVVPPWSRRVVDLFFDSVRTAEADLLRLHLRQREADGRLQLYECQFFLLEEDDPRRPGDEALHDPDFGYRDGYYFPGWGDLGERRLRTADQVRLFHLFHDPEAGLIW
ncbi:MAG: hypothetical protein ACI9EF_003457 [Pseudohongiellaceae bacterium]|jgi:hypothetical protein